MDKKNLEELAGFIKEHRSNEASFEILQQKIDEEIATGNDAYTAQLQNLKEKAAAEYITAKEISGSAWPEFEKFASGLERIVFTFLHKE